MFEVDEKDNIDAVLAQLDATMHAALDRIVDEVIQRARRYAPRKTGALRDAIGMERTFKTGAEGSEGAESWVAILYVDSPYAAPVEYGSAGRGEGKARPPDGWPQEDAPEKQAKGPYFNAYYQQYFDIPKHGGRYKGMHPGVRPRPFVRPAIIDVIFRHEKDKEVFLEAFENSYRRAATT